ncbi:MAG: hypothetical protein GY711_26320 [bacterium]|nr:hypothetical protein [bacterium]
MTIAALLQEHTVKEGFGEKDFHNQTTLHPLGLAAILVLGIATLVVPRRYALLPMAILACFIPPAQRLVLFTLDFSLLRILVLFGWLRVILRGELRSFRLKRLDTVIFAWAFVSAAAYVTLRGSSEAFINRLGGTYDVVGMYVLFRVWIRDLGDIDRVVSWMILLSVPVFVFFMMERATGRNPFAVFGGVPPITKARAGRLRCQGPFHHPILAGCFWAAFVPLVAARFFRGGRGKFTCAVGMTAMGGIVFLSASSTPVLGVGLAAIGWAGWLLRKQMRIVRWGTLATLVGLHMVMEAPVWHLISRVGAVQGSTAYHRYLLIDRCISSWREWFLIGTPSTAHWGHQMFDLTNQYVREAVKGGFLALILFVAFVFYAHGGAGRLWRRFQKLRYARALAWGVGVSLFAQSLMFLSISISHSQQNLMVWFFVLAAIGSLAPVARRSRGRVPGPPQPRVRERRPAEQPPAEHLEAAA